jgi:hypothetical protein
MEDVDDDLHVIEHDPLAGWESIDRDGAKAMIGFQASFDFARDGLQVRLGSAGADHKKIGEGRDAPEIEDHDLLRFLVGREVSAGFG